MDSGRISAGIHGFRSKNQNLGLKLVWGRFLARFFHQAGRAGPGRAMAETEAGAETETEPGTKPHRGSQLGQPSQLSQLGQLSSASSASSASPASSSSSASSAQPAQPAQHSTAQHSTAQHCTAQHSTGDFR